jgi:hypothetical protein
MPARCASSRFALPNMQEEGNETPAEPPATVPEFQVQEPEPPQEQGIDLSKYSITITIGLAFLVVKLLTFFDIVDLN